jgi:hypothetical protein
VSYSVFHNPKNVSIGGVPLTGVVAIVVSQSYAELHAAADGDAHESVARYTTGRTGGAIRLVDPVQAAAAAGAAGTLSFTWTDARGVADRTVTIEGCSLGGYEAAVSRDAVSAATVPFIAESAPVVV